MAGPAKISNGERSAVMLLSGGLDSMVAAGIAREQGYSLHALTIDYNQRH
jgi:7-cyano-7-deazaguanine synthase